MNLLEVQDKLRSLPLQQLATYLAKPETIPPGVPYFMILSRKKEMEDQMKEAQAQPKGKNPIIPIANEAQMQAQAGLSAAARQQPQQMPPQMPQRSISGYQSGGPVINYQSGGDSDWLYGPGVIGNWLYDYLFRQRDPSPGRGSVARQNNAAVVDQFHRDLYGGPDVPPVVSAEPSRAMGNAAAMDRMIGAGHPLGSPVIQIPGAAPSVDMAMPSTSDPFLPDTETPAGVYEQPSGIAQLVMPANQMAGNSIRSAYQQVGSADDALMPASPPFDVRDYTDSLRAEVARRAGDPSLSPAERDFYAVLQSLQNTSRSISESVNSNLPDIGGYISDVEDYLTRPSPSEQMIDDPDLARKIAEGVVPDVSTDLPVYDGTSGWDNFDTSKTFGDYSLPEDTLGVPLGGTAGGGGQTKPSTRTVGGGGIGLTSLTGNDVITLADQIGDYIGFKRDAWKDNPLYADVMAGIDALGENKTTEKERLGSVATALGAGISKYGLRGGGISYGARDAMGDLNEYRKQDLAVDNAILGAKTAMWEATSAAERGDTETMLSMYSQAAQQVAAANRLRLAAAKASGSGGLGSKDMLDWLKLSYKTISEELYKVDPISGAVEEREGIDPDRRKNLMDQLDGIKALSMMTYGFTPQALLNLGRETRPGVITLGGLTPEQVKGTR